MMFRRVVALSFVIQVAIVLACSDSPTAPETAPSLQTSAAAIPSGPSGTAQADLAGGRLDVLVNMRDACDPDSFNAVLGPGACIRSGGVTFEQFIAELTRLTFAPSWRFAPQSSSVRVGQTFVAENKGGEVHTFTEVAAFGGGIVDSLNELAKTPTITPECDAIEPDDFVAPGSSYREEITQAGIVKFQCCIHPWMRLEARVSNK